MAAAEEVVEEVKGRQGGWNGIQARGHRVLMAMVRIIYFFKFR